MASISLGEKWAGWAVLGGAVACIGIFPRAMQSDLGFYLLLGFAGGIALFIWGLGAKKKKDLVAVIPTSKIRSLAMGTVEVVGKAQPFGKLWKSPFCLKDAVYYKFIVTLHERKKETKTVAEFETNEFFYVEDDTGNVLVDPHGADLRFQQDEHYMVAPFGIGEKPERITEGLARLGIPMPSLGLTRRLECEETYILPGDTVYVLGFAKSPLDGRAAIGDGAVPAVIAKEEGQYFCISDRDEKEVLMDLNVELFMGFYFGPVLTAVCLFFLLKA